jgi:transposase InsO family protein
VTQITAAQRGPARSTVARWLGREGLERRDAIDPQKPVRRHQPARRGELIRLDSKKPGRFDHSGHRVTGTGTIGRSRGAGWHFVRVAVDDATRLACVGVPGNGRQQTTIGFLLRAVHGFRSQGIRAERALTDNGSAHRSGRFGKALRLLAIRHNFTRPCTPKTNGKAERFGQTVLRECACGLAHQTLAARNAGLPRWLDGFNGSTPRSALVGRTPLSTGNDLPRTHS